MWYYLVVSLLCDLSNVVLLSKMGPVSSIGEVLHSLLLTCYCVKSWFGSLPFLISIHLDSYCIYLLKYFFIFFWYSSLRIYNCVSKAQLLDCDKFVATSTQYRILTSRDQLPMTSTNCIMTMDHTIPMTNFFHFLLRCLSTAQWATVLLHSTENPSRPLYRYNPPYMRRRRLPSFSSSPHVPALGSGSNVNSTSKINQRIPQLAYQTKLRYGWN